MYGRRNPLQRMEVIGYDPYTGQPYVANVGARLAINPSNGGFIPGPMPLGSTAPGTPATPTLAAAATSGGGGIVAVPPAYLGGGPTMNPGWRQGQLAPGVESPQEGMVPLPMNPQQGSPAGTFSATVTAITYQGQLQKPYRAERLIVNTVRTGTSATGLLLSQIFVGVDLQQGDITPLPIESLGGMGAFGTRLTLMQAPPGVLIRMPVTLSSNPTGTDTIFAVMFWLGRILH